MDWALKHQPRTPKEYIGMKSDIQIISNFLDLWIGDVPPKKAIILFGEPGNGKTSIVYALESTYNLNIIEVNASDDRNATDIKKLYHKTGLNAFDDKMTVMLLDEVDGINAWETLGTLVDNSMCPIFMTCNNIDVVPYDLSKKCISLEIRYPPTDYVIRRLTEIARKEHLDMDNRAISTIAERCISVRSAILTLQSCALTGSTKRIIPHDVDYSEYEQIRRLFSGESCAFDLSPEVVKKWAISNGVPIHKLDKMITMGREYPNLQDVVESYAMTLRGNIEKLKSPYYVAFKKFKKKEATKKEDEDEKPKKKFVAKEERKPEIEKAVVVGNNSFGDDLW
ncbi:AAA family ATPase [Sulfuricurvum sp.]|uniref:AAA family ATPase n=1 Tax=Sulfuricurvum sp. TaxID=2025608 RepID=UPI003569A642